MQPIMPTIPTPLMVLDGGLATELERRGFDLNHRLWSASVLQKYPEAIAAVHQDFLCHGAQCITTASYQLSYPACHELGLSKPYYEQLLNSAVEVALQAVDVFLAAGPRRAPFRPRVAASMGPYAAYLADGSEYSGEYSVDVEELEVFHQQQYATLAASRADLLVFETIPNISEAGAIRNLLLKNPERPVWVSFCCRDSDHLSDGSSLKQAFELFEDIDAVVALGINCTAPEFVTPLLTSVRDVAQRKSRLVYPNSGEHYDGASKCWHAKGEAGFIDNVEDWIKLGAQIIGGCCRTTPLDIQNISNTLNALRAPGMAK